MALHKKGLIRRCLVETISNPYYAIEIALLTNTLTEAESLLYSLEHAAGVIGLHVNAEKTRYMFFNQERDISILKVGSL